MIKMNSEASYLKYKIKNFEKKKIENAIFLKDKMKFFKSKGYRIKVDENSYMLFKKEEDYLKLFFLEKFYVDFYKNLYSKQDERIRLFFRISLIQKYIESLSQIEIVVLNDSRKTENPFKVKFPELAYIDRIDLTEIGCYEIFDLLEDTGNEVLVDKFIESIILLGKVIRVKYLKKRMRHRIFSDGYYDVLRFEK